MNINISINMPEKSEQLSSAKTNSIPNRYVSLLESDFLRTLKIPVGKLDGLISESLLLGTQQSFWLRCSPPRQQKL